MTPDVMMAASTLHDHVETWRLMGTDLEIRAGGTGPRVLLLHGAYGWWGWEPVHGHGVGPRGAVQFRDTEGGAADSVLVGRRHVVLAARDGAVLFGDVRIE
jgi:hypothetical protein